MTGQDGALTVSTAGTILNQYSALAANATQGGSTVTVTSIAELDATAVGFGPLAPGDELMVIQMQGASIQTTNNAGYGTVTALGNAGLYEIVNVASITNNTITITTTDCGGLRNAYTTAARAQVVRIPQLASLTVTGTGSITGRPWDGVRGGIVALHVGGTATIDGGGIAANAIGFRGGAADDAASGNGITSFRTANATEGGEKGEGIAGDATAYDALNGRFGRGAPANAGGGGNAHNAGGGGGANGNNGNTYTGQGVMDGTVTGAAAWQLDPGFAANGNALTNSAGGGRGGYTFSGANQDAVTVGPGNATWAGDNRREVGGLGGRPVDNDPATRLFLGGGGGAGDGNNTAAGAGGNGGGLVLVIANRVEGAGAITANGGNGNVSSHDPGDAPGGGGGGGTIVVRANTLAAVTATANGGAGGLQTLAANLEAEGPGGGGGGGFIAVSGGAITRSAAGGAGGTTNRAVLSEFPTNGATRGATGTANATVGTIPACLGDVSIAIADSPDPVLDGGTLTYTVTATNAGPNPATGLVVVDTLPAGVALVSATGAGWVCNPVGQIVTCTRATLAGNSSAAIAIVVTVNTGAGTLTNTATITATTADTSTANNTDSETTTVTANTNDPPVNAVPGAQTTPEDAPLAIAGVSISDPDAGGAQVQVTLTAANGTLTISTAGLTFSTGDGTGDATMTFTGTIAQINAALANLVFAPTANFNGAASVTITTNDLGNTGSGGAETDTDTIAITVTPVNDPPNAVNDARTVAEDSGATVLNVLNNDTITPDVGETLTVTAVTQPANGTAAIIGGTNVTFTPAANFSGTTSFTYTINDGNGGTDTATVTVTVTPVNDPPSAANDARTVAEDSAATLLGVLANDSIAPDTGETLTITAVTQPANGAVAIAGGTNVTFQPAANFNGTTTFTYTIDDGNGGTDTATVTVTVTPVNDPPNAVNDARTVAEDSAATAMNVLGNDSIAPDAGETLAITAITQPANGSAAIIGGGTNVTFTPAAGFAGTTSFTYTINDGNGGTDTATVTVTVTAVNDPPSAVNDTATVAEDSGPTSIDVFANDSIAPDTGETLTVIAVTQPVNGTVVITGGGTGITFEPAPNFFGTATFTYTISDGNGGTDTATITITITPVNDPPTAVDDTKAVAKDAPPTSIDVLANDSSAPDAVETLTVTAITQPATGGTVAINAGGTGVTFQPTAGFEGVATFTYTIDDGAGGIATATVTVAVGTDTDGDGLPDVTEVDIGTDPTDADSDDDGVIDGNEPSPGVDSDGDGLIDALDPDSDNDGLFDGTEVGITTPHPDTDVGNGHFIPDADPSTRTDPRDPDTDDGSVEDGAEDTDRDGEVDPGERDPNDPDDDVGVIDTDGDGLPDATEEDIGTDPDDADSDDDGVLDGDEPNFQDDTDGDGMINALDPDSDNDGLKDGTELGITMPDPDTDVGAGNFTPDADPTTTTSPVDPDTDDGGVSDGDEDADHDGMIDNGERDPNNPDDDMGGVVPPMPDGDGDGIFDQDDNCPEANNPDQADADGDGLGDACDPDADGDGLNDNLGVSGGGCATGSDTGGGALVLALAVLVGLRRRRWLVAAIVAIVPALAHAQAVQGEARNFSVERFQLATDRNGLLNVEWAESRGGMAFDVALWIGYANDPLVVYTDMGGERERVGSLVQNRTAAALSASLSPTRWLTVGFDLPMVIAQDRDANMAVSPMLESLSSFGIGDLRVLPKFSLLRQDRHGIGVAIIPAVIVPTQSSDSDYLGDRGAGFVPTLAVSRRWDSGWRWALDFGWHMRKRARLVNLIVDDELFVRTGVGYRFRDRGGPPVELDLTFAGAAAAGRPFESFNESYLEALAGPSVAIGGSTVLFAGAGVGLHEGFGTPDWRALAGLRIGTADQKRRLVEKKPIDTDRDGILDVADRCPTDPEDIDSFEDADGCPDPDNDKDTVLDAADTCPLEPGLVELKGCPSKDGDGDGIADHADRCATEPEDFDKFEDGDGCPEPDNDKDTVLDAADACPIEAGPPDNQGCPDKDRDGDTVVDRLDNCPDEKGDPANQGCVKKQLVTITNTKIEILESVYFQLDKAVILPRSFKLLDNVASVLGAHDKLIVEVQGHTDSRGDDAYNKKLSQRRADAVMAYLIKKKVPAARLTAVGYGEAEPVADNTTNDGRAQNRRVVFKIVGSTDGTKIDNKQQGAGEDTKEKPEKK